MNDPQRLFVSLAVLAMACSCSPEAKGPEQESANDAGPQAQVAPRAATQETVQGDRPKAAEAALRLTAAGARRCGWLHNPTPANWWLIDRDGEWILAVQGGYQAPGMDEMPDMSESGWVEVNGHYGYGCACMDIEADPASRRVLRVSAASPKPLAQCRNDRRLRDPGAE